MKKVRVKESPLLWAMFAGVLLAYLLLLTKNYYWDGIFFAQTIEQAAGLDSSLLHPNHLLYDVPGYLLYRLARGLGLQVRAVVILQLINCFVSAGCAYLLFRILRDCFKSTYLSASLTVIFAFSQTWWKFSTDADSYILSVFFLLAAFYLTLPGRRPRPILTAIMHALSMLFHQLAIFFFPVIILGLLFQTRSEPTRRRAIILLQYTLTAFLITFPAFYLSFYFVTGSFSFKPFIKWVTTFSPEHGFTFSAWDNLVYTLRGHSRLFFGGRISFLREFMGPHMIAMVAAVLTLLLLFFYRLLRHFREFKAAVGTGLKRGGEYRELRILCAVWAGIYLLFLFFFIPQNTFYRLFYLPALIVLLGTLLAPYELAPGHVRRYRTALFAALVFATNLAFSAYPYSQIRSNPPLALALKLNEAWPPATVVYFNTWNSDNSLVRYFNPSTVWKEASPASIEREIKSNTESGPPVWIDTTLIDALNATPEGRSWVGAHTEQRPEYQLVNRKFRLQFFRVVP